MLETKYATQNYQRIPSEIPYNYDSTTDNWCSDYVILQYSISCRFSEIRSHIQLSNEQKWCISKQTRLFVQIFHKEKYLSLYRESYTDGYISLLNIIKPSYKRNGYKGGYIVGFFNPPEKTLPTEKC